jgi:two-component system, LytTR family, response regulator
MKQVFVHHSRPAAAAPKRPRAELYLEDSLVLVRNDDRCLSTADGTFHLPWAGARSAICRLHHASSGVMRRIRAVIADDEPLARELLRTLLGDYPDIEVVHECGDGREVVAAVRSASPDVIFLDIQMPELDGFEVIEAIDPSALPHVVFVTAYDDFAIRAFDTHAVDYLLKPFDDERLARALQRVRQRLGSVSAAQLSRTLEEVTSRRRYRDRLPVREEGRTRFVNLSAVNWIEAIGKHTRVHTDSETILLKQGLSQLEEQLDPNVFMRVNRSAIVCIACVREVLPWSKGEHLLKLQNGTTLHTGKVYRERVEQALGIG